MNAANVAAKYGVSGSWTRLLNACNASVPPNAATVFGTAATRSPHSHEKRSRRGISAGWGCVALLVNPNRTDSDRLRELRARWTERVSSRLLKNPGIGLFS